jgi:hypothetical protein
MVNMKKIIITVLLSLIGIGIITVFSGYIFSFIQFNNEVRELFLSSKNISHIVFTSRRISALPEPVQRYFRYVLKEGQPYISYARLKHDGQFKTGMDKDWVNIEGEQYFTCEKPGFIWKGNLSPFTARDMFINDKGRLIVSLFSTFKIVNGEGDKYNQGELLRWICENAWFPTNYLPGKYFKWTPIDSGSAGLTFNNNDISLYCKVSFNDKGEITQFETMRYMDEKRLETWIGRCSDYQEINGIKIPVKIEAIWRLKTGDFSYARFNIKEIEYNKPVRY